MNLLTERRVRGPGGRSGGQDGAPGKNCVRAAQGETLLPGKVTVRVAEGEILSIESPGGGGWGTPTSERRE